MFAGVKRISYILLVTGTLLSLSSNAQWSDAMTQVASQKDFTAGIYGGIDASSNCITTSFATNFFSGNYISDALKHQVVENLEKFNRLGYNLNYGIYGVWRTDTINHRTFNFFFAMRHKATINAVFSPDAFNLAFFGNAMYAGRTANLAPFNFMSMSYNQAEIGLVSTDFGGKAQLGMGLSFLAGQKLLAVGARNATLYTDPTGQNLQFNSNAEMYQSDTAGNSKFINGYGASLDLYFKAPYKIGKRSGVISVSATDMGFMYWNKNSLYYHKDTSYFYDGVTINNITDLQNVGFGGVSKDSLQNKYIPFAKKALFYTIPSTLSVNTNTDFGKYHLEVGYWYVFNSNDVGYYYVQGDKYLNSGWMTALQLGYGGYETFNLEFLFSKQTKNSTFKLALDHLQGLLLPNKFGGAGAYVEYSHSFGK
jgi:hypothetical protein